MEKVMNALIVTGLSLGMLASCNNGQNGDDTGSGSGGNTEIIDIPGSEPGQGGASSTVPDNTSTNGSGMSGSGSATGSGGGGVGDGATEKGGNPNTIGGASGGASGENGTATGGGTTNGGSGGSGGGR